MNANDFTPEELARMKDLFADFNPRNPYKPPKPEVQHELSAILEAMAKRKGKKIRELANREDAPSG